MTHKKQNILSPEARQAMLASIVDTSDDVIISKTLKGIITSWNKAAERMFGYTEAEAIGQHISLIIPKSHLDEEDMILSRIASGQTVDHFETIRVSKSGEELPITLSVSPIVDKSGKIIGASKIARDISERISADAKQARLAAIVDSSDDMIVSKTLEGIITSWNKAAERMFGYSEAEVVGKHISIIIPPDRMDEEHFIINRIKAGLKIDHFETYRITKDQRLIPISLTVSPILNSKGKVIGASKIARDITEQIRAKEEAKQLYNQIQVLNERKDEFIALASHELKTPLSTISGYLQILSRLQTDSQGEKFIGRTLDQLKRLTALVNDLLDVSMIEAGKMHLRTERFDIMQVIENTIELFQDSASHTIVFQSNVDDFFIEGDAHRIEQVMTNLLTNAIKYSPQSDRIEVSLVANHHTIKVGVKDYGVGINPEKINNIFSRFYRVEENNPNISGLGIGLFLSKQIITKHSGTLWVETSPGHGSTFWFSLPINEGEIFHEDAV